MLSLATLALLAAARAHAFAPAAAAANAERVAGALAARTAPGHAWADAARVAVLARAEAEVADPEGAAARHRFAAGAAVPAEGDALSLAAAAVTGAAPLELVRAHAALRVAYGARDEVAVVDALARLAVAATDLADPFLVGDPAAAEVPGARAWFGDLVGDAALDALARTAPGDGAVAGAVDVTTAALTLAHASRARREPVEIAVVAGDGPALDALRRERLDAAAATALGLALDAWRAAGAPVLGATDDGVRATPNPARDSATLGFVLATAGPARLELFDVSGRRVLARELGTRPAGPQQARLERADLVTLAPGVYLARVSAAGARVSGRLVRGAD